MLLTSLVAALSTQLTHVAWYRALYQPPRRRLPVVGRTWTSQSAPHVTALPTLNTFRNRLKTCTCFLGHFLTP